MTLQNAVVVFFLANFCYCLAYLVRDIFLLRVLSIVAALLTFPYFIMQQQVMFSALFWQSAFVVINLFNVILLVLERRPVPLTEDEAGLKDIVFRHLTSRETASLLESATWKSGQPGDVLVQYGVSPDHLFLLYAGNLEVKRNSHKLAYRGPGSFIGEIAYMTGAKASAEVVLTVPSRYVQWDIAELRKHLAKKPQLKSAFESLLAINVAHKLGAEEAISEDHAEWHTEN